MTTTFGATKVFLPFSAVKKVEEHAHSYNTKKQQQKLSSQSSQEIQYDKQGAQFNKEDVLRHGDGIIRGGQSVDRSQKPALFDHGKKVPGHAKRVHDYEFIPGPKKVHGYATIPGPPDEFQSNSDKEILSKLVKQPLLNVHQPQLEHHNSDRSSAIKDQNPYNLEIGSMIQFSNPPHYGVVKWIGYLRDTSKNSKIAGVEMVKMHISHMYFYSAKINYNCNLTVHDSTYKYSECSISYCKVYVSCMYVCYCFLTF